MFLIIEVGSLRGEGRGMGPRKWPVFPICSLLWTLSSFSSLSEGEVVDEEDDEESDGK